MSWHFLQEREEASWEASCLDGAPCALLSLMHTAAGCCSPDSGTDSCRDSQSGTMCRPSTEGRGGGGWMWSVEDSLAPTYQPQARAQGSKESNPACGSTWFASSVRYDRNTSSWKTAHCLLSEDLPWFSVTLPKWGMMRAGELWERVTSVLRTAATASGSWATPVANNQMSATIPALLKEAQRLHPRGQWSLATQVAAEYATGNRMWPTPCANEDAAGRPGSKMQKMLGNHCEIRGDLTGGTLSADWTEWLMGWPIGHTDLKPLATDKFQQWLRSHGAYSEGQQHED